MYIYIHTYIYIYIYIHIYIYIYICISVHTYMLNKKVYINKFFILTNLPVVLHNLLQCVWIKHVTKSLHTQLK